MKIRTLTLLNTCCLAAIAIGLATLTHVELTTIEMLFKRNDSFNSISEDYRVNVKTVISHYLKSGDTFLLSKAEEKLTDTLSTTSEYATELDEPNNLDHIIDTSQNLLLLLQSDVRAAGKMSGNIELLLDQNEREIADNLDSLKDLSNEVDIQNNSSSPNELADSIPTDAWSINSSEALYELVQLSILRHAYFNQPTEAALKAIQNKLSELQNIIYTLKQLEPLPNPQREDNDSIDFFDDEDDEESNKSQDILNELSYLLKRYPDELYRTRNQQEKVLTSTNQVNEYLEEIENQLALESQANAQILADELTQFQTKMLILIAFIILIAVLVDQIQRRVSGRIQQITPFFSNYSRGDFTQEFNLSATTAELQSLIRSGGRLRHYMLELLSAVKNQSLSLNQLTSQISDTSKAINRHCQEQVEETTEAHNSMSDITRKFQEVAHSAAHAAEVTKLANSSVNQGMKNFKEIEGNVSEMVESVSQAATTIESLQNQTTDITQVLTVIENIAEQTNLLALNAAIEAARAGEHGRGFSVVADEVRQLSIRTSESTQEIKSIITKLQDTAKSSVSIMNQHVEKARHSHSSAITASNALQSISNAVVKIDQLNSNIAATTDDQAQLVDHMHSNIGKIRGLSENTTQSITMILHQSDELTEISEGLQSSVQRFKV
jgi:methyl-accepting chemotaxis protein